MITAIMINLPLAWAERNSRPRERSMRDLGFGRSDGHHQKGLIGYRSV